MKKLLLFVLLPFCVFAQHTIILKSGEQMQGKLIEFKDSLLIFSFKQNILKLNEKNVVSIIFDSKFSNQNINADKDAKIKGVVTYYFNRNYGYKPDIGAKIYIINEEFIASIDTLSIYNYIRAKVIRDIMALSGYEDNWEAELRGLGAETEQRFETLDNKASEAIREIAKNNKTIKLTVDGNGTFSKSLGPGKYLVLIISKNRISATHTEIMGKIHYQKIILKGNSEEFITAEFDQY